MPRRRTQQEPVRAWPRAIVLKLPSNEECCTPAETVFWNQTMQMALNGSRPREVAEFAATGLDDPLLSRAIPTIREAVRKWAAMGDVWQDYDWEPSSPAPSNNWYEPEELWPAG